MATQLIVRRVCDECANAGEDMDAGFHFAWTELGLELDACGDHAQRILAVQSMFSEFGGKMGREGNPDGDNRDPQECPVCHGTYKNRTSLAAHVRAQHGTTIGTLEGRSGADYPCPDCDRRFTAPQGLASHRRLRHGTPGRGPKSAVA